MYTDVELLPIEDVERYAQSQINHIKNQYRNKVRPLKKYIQDEKLRKMMGTLDMMEEEIWGGKKNIYRRLQLIRIWVSWQ